MNQFVIKRSRLTEIAYPNRLKGWRKKQDSLPYPIYYLLPAKKWLRRARLRQSGLAFATFDDLAKLILDCVGIAFTETTEHQRKIFMQELMLRQYTDGDHREEKKHEAIAYANTYGQLKRMGFPLDQLPARLHAMRPLLEEYEEKWVNQGFLDPENLILEAIARARELSELPIGHLVVDGFYDLSPLQYQLLQAVVDLKIPVTIYLPDVPGAELVQETRHHLSQMGFSSSSGPKSSLKLKHQRVKQASSVEEEIHGMLDEVVEQAGQKGWDSFGVLLLNEQEYSQPFQRIARQRGIPLKQPSYIPLQETQFYRFLITSLKENYAREDKWGRLGLFDLFLRLLYVSPQEYTKMKQGYLESGVLPKELQPLFDPFLFLHQSLSEEGTLESYLHFLLEYLQRQRFAEHWKKRLDAENTEFLQKVCTEWKAYDHLILMLTSKKEELQDRGLGSYPVYLDTFLEWVEELIQSAKIYQDRTPMAGLGLYTLRDAALFSGSHLYVLGMNDGVFPSPHQLQGYFQETDLDRMEFPFAKPDQRTYLAKQDLLFKQLAYLSPFVTLSYVVGSDQENPLLPSKYVGNRKLQAGSRARMRTYTFSNKQRLKRKNTPSTRAIWSTASRFSRKKGGEYLYFSQTDWMEKLAYHFGRGRQLSKVPDPLLEMRSHLERLQEGRETLTTAWQQELYKDTVAVTALESYAACRFRYAMERLLEIKEPIERLEQVDAREKGSLQHRFIQRFYTGLGVVEKPFSVFREEGLEAVAVKQLEELFESLWKEVEEKNKELSPVVLQKEKDSWWKTFRKWWSAERYHFWNNPELEGMRISRFEKEIRLHLAIDEDTNITVEGKLDRLDRDEEGFVIYDYKSGKASMNLHSEVKPGLKLQLPLYLLAVQEEFESLSPHGASYVSLKDPAKRAKNGIWDHEKATRFNVSKQAQKVKELDASVFVDEHQLRDRVHTLWKGMHQDFSVSPLDCQPWCPYKMVCRVTKTQIEEGEDSWT